MHETPRIDNQPYLSHKHDQLTIEGWSRAGIQSYWRIPELRIGFDLGGIPWDWTSTGTWFLSHGHLDHMLALPGFLGRRAMLKYPPPKIYVPFEVVDDVVAMLAAWEKLDRAKLACEVVGLAPGNVVDVSKYHRVSAFQTAHPVPSRGFVVWERRQKLLREFTGLPGESIGELRRSGTHVTEEVLVPLVCYTGDTGPAGLEAETAVFSAKILIVEMSFAKADQTRERIHRFGHLHLEDFLERSDRFENELIIAGHITSRDEPTTVNRLSTERLPADLRKRLVVWGAERMMSKE